MMTLHTLGEADFAQPQQQEFDDVIDRLTRRGCAGQGR
jgi:hypothetical protein